MIPIYKSNKQDANNLDPKFFRPVCLAECTFKVLETIWIKKKYEILSDESGDDQFAYLIKRGSGEALKRLKMILDRVNKCVILSVDIKSAFDSISRIRLIEIMLNRFGNDGFINI